MLRASVCVIGAGAVGASAAYYLSQLGAHVQVIDQGRFGGGCSHGNCGYVCPSHVLPLAEDGAIRGALQAMLRPNSPFTIRPRLDPALWSWLWQFARRCSDDQALYAGRALQSLLDSSMSLYRELVDGKVLDCEWQQRGILYVYRSPDLLDAYASTDQLLREVFNRPATRLGPRELLALEPAIKHDVAGAWHYDCDAHLRPDKLMSSWKQALLKAGVTIHENQPLVGFERQGPRAVAAITTLGKIQADAFIVATGAWSPKLATILRCNIPIQPGKGYSITMQRPTRCPTIPMIFPETRVAVTPMETGYRLGSTMEFAGYDTTLNRKRLDLLRRGAEPYLIEPYTDGVEEEWFGWRPMTPDGLPLIGRIDATPNITIAAGNNMIGIATATATGKLAAELTLGQAPDIPPTPFEVGRFG